MVRAEANQTAHRAWWVVGCALVVGCTAEAAPPSYPQAHTVDVVDEYHGVEVADPYRWMEDLEDPALHDWMAAQDEVTRGYLADDRPLVEWIADRTFALGNFASDGAPTVRGERAFFVRRAVGEVFGRLMVSEDGGARELLDFEETNQGASRTAVMAMSWNGEYVAVTEVDGASAFRRWNTVRILDVDTGAWLDESLVGFYAGQTNVAWTHDGRGFYYVAYPVPDEPQAPLGTPAVYHHRLGTPQSSDRRVFDVPDAPTMSLALRISQEGRYLIVSGSESGGTLNGMFDRIFYADLEAGERFVELLPGVPGAVSYEGNMPGRFLIRTANDAPRLRLVAVELARPSPQHWSEVVPEADMVMQSVGQIADHLVVVYSRDARTLARVFDGDGEMLHEVDHLVPSMGGFADHPTDPVTYYVAPQLFDPGTVHSLNVRTGEQAVHFRPELAHDPDEFETRQVFFSSADETRVPMFLVHKKGLELDGRNPVFMYGYGAWAWSAFPWQASMMPWMELGGVYAVPNIRGGGEYGDDWHRAGIGRNKQKGIDDFIAAAEWLVDNGYTSTDRMIANGGSASGILPAAAMVQRPELFGAAVINYPSLDQVRFHLFGNGASWMPEFGNPDDPDDFEALYAYSAYHRLEEGVCYPPTWIQVGEKDDTTTPMHGYKFAAALQASQAATAGCSSPALLKIAWDAGHSWGATPEQSRETQAEELAFLVRVLGLDIPREIASELER